MSTESSFRGPVECPGHSCHEAGDARPDGEGGRRWGGRVIWLVLPPLSLNHEQKPIRTPNQPSDNVIFFCCSGDQTFKRKRGIRDKTNSKIP